MCCRIGVRLLDPRSRQRAGFRSGGHDWGAGTRVVATATPGQGAHMKSLLVLVVRPAAVVLAVIVGAFAAARVPSLAGFVLGAVLAGASILLLTVRGVGIRRRPVPAVSLRYDRPAWSHPY